MLTIFRVAVDRVKRTFTITDILGGQEEERNIVGYNFGHGLDYESYLEYLRNWY